MHPQDVTGLVLAGGQGSRMGGVDKGLQPFGGQPLVANVLQRLQPQVGPVVISANRHKADYQAFGHPVVADAQSGFPGPLAGVLAGLAYTHTPWLAVVPCDAPWLPTDLVARLHASATAALSPCAYAATLDEAGAPVAQPVFCLLRRELHDDLASWLVSGGRRMREWLARHNAAQALFDGPQAAQAFFNANRLEDLQRGAG